MGHDLDLAQARLSRRRFLRKTVAGTAIAGMSALGTINPAFASTLNTLTSSTSADLSHGGDPRLVLGHDISTLQQLESVGKTFTDNGNVQPLERILANHGATYIRERLWVNRPMPFNDLPHVLAMARPSRLPVSSSCLTSTTPISGLIQGNSTRHKPGRARTSASSRIPCTTIPDRYFSSSPIRVLHPRSFRPATRSQTACSGHLDRSTSTATRTGRSSPCCSKRPLPECVMAVPVIVPE